MPSNSLPRRKTASRRYFDETTSLLRTARFEMSDKSVYIIKITGYKHKSLPASTFKFDKSQVPAGTEVADLR